MFLSFTSILICGIIFLYKKKKVGDKKLKSHERIRYLRKDVLHMTQEEFAKSIKISRSNLGNIETGAVSTTERVLSDICDVHDANMDWLLKGEGLPIREKTRTEKITDFAADILKEEEESFRRRLVEALADLEIEEWELLEKIAEKAMKKRKS